MTVWSSTASIINNNLRFTFAESQAPQTIVQNTVIPGPHSFPKAVSFGGFNPVAHIVRIYTTPDASLGTLLSEFLYNPTWSNVEVRLPVEIPVDTGAPYSPAEGSTTLIIDGVADPSIPTIKGWKWIPKMRTRGGQLSSDEYTRIDPDEDGEGGVGFEFTEGFYAPDFIFIEFLPKITISSPTVNYLKLFAGINEIIEDVTVDNTHINMLNEVNSINPVVNITFPSYTEFPLFTLLRYTTVRGAQNQVAFIAAEDEFFKWDGGDWPELYAGRCEVFEFLRGADGWHVTSDLPGMRMVGLSVSADTGLLQACVNPNILPYDGGSMPAAEWPRVLWYCLRLPGGMFIPIGSRNEANAGLWAYTEVAGVITTLHRPDKRGYHQRNIPGTKGNDSGRSNTTQAGTNDDSYSADHSHFTVVDAGYTTSGFGPLVSALKSMVAWWSKSSGSGKESTWLAAVNDASDPEPTLSPTSVGGKRRTPSTPQTENTVKSTGVVGGFFC